MYYFANLLGVRKQGQGLILEIRMQMQYENTSEISTKGVFYSFGGNSSRIMI